MSINAEANKKDKAKHISLKPGKEEDLFKTIQGGVKLMRDSYGVHASERTPPLNREGILKTIDNNAPLCLQLHVLLKRRECPPIYSRYLLKNRGTSTSECVEFYRHFHSQEDLVNFITEGPQKTLGSTQKIDTTMGEEFTIRIYTKRWGHEDTYSLTRNIDGWYFRFMGDNGNTGQCDREGHPFLFKNLKHDDVCYPSKLKSYMSSIWYRADSGETKEQVQEHLDKVAKWISGCEKNEPEKILI